MPLRCRHASFFCPTPRPFRHASPRWRAALGGGRFCRSEAPEKNSEVIFSTSEIKIFTSDVEKTTSEVVHSVSEVGALERGVVLPADNRADLQSASMWFSTIPTRTWGYPKLSLSATLQYLLLSRHPRRLRCFLAMEMGDSLGIMPPPMQIECFPSSRAAAVAVTYLYLLSFRSVLSL